MRIDKRIEQLEKLKPTKKIKLVFIQTEETKEEVVQRDGIDESDPASEYIFIQFIKSEMKNLELFLQSFSNAV